MLTDIIVAIIYSISAFVIWGRLGNKKAKINIESILMFIFMIIVSVINKVYFTEYLRLTTMILMFTFAVYIIFKENIENSFLYSIIYEIGIVVAELVFLIIISLFMPNLDVAKFLLTTHGTIIANIMIFLIIVILTELKFYRSIYKIILKIKDKTSKYQIVYFVMIAIISYNVIFIMTFHHENLLIMILVNIAILLVYAYSVLSNLKIRSKYFSLSSKYTDSIKNLKEYEKMIDVYRISNHENKNQMLTIRNMIINKDEKVVNYIDKIVDNKLKDDDKIMYETSIIPEGGLRASIYSKMLLMKSKKVNYTLNVDREVRNVNLSLLKDRTILNICKIVNVFLDNAIDAALETDNPSVGIQLYVDNDFIIEISNKFEGRVNVEEIYDEGYTTKANGHGYGLALVKSIINNSKILENQIEIVADIFIQKLTIKNKIKK